MKHKSFFDIYILRKKRVSYHLHLIDEIDIYFFIIQNLNHALNYNGLCCQNLSACMRNIHSNFEKRK